MRTENEKQLTKFLNGQVDMDENGNVTLSNYDYWWLVRKAEKEANHD